MYNREYDKDGNKRGTWIVRQFYSSGKFTILKNNFETEDLAWDYCNNLPYDIKRKCDVEYILSIAEELIEKLDLAGGIGEEHANMFKSAMLPKDFEEYEKLKAERIAEYILQLTI